MGLRLTAEVGLDGSGFEAGLKRLEHAGMRAFEGLKGAAMAAFGIYGIEQAIRKTMEYGERLIDTSRRLGIGTDALQEFGFAARQNGADIDALTGFIEKLNSARIDPKKLGAFQKLGVSEADLHSLGVEDLMMKISANVRTRSSQEVIGPLRQIGGRGAGELLPMLKENMAEVRAEAEKLGQVMHAKDAVMLKFLDDEMKILAQTIMVGLAPAIVWVAGKFMHFIGIIQSIGTLIGNIAGQSRPGDWKTLMIAQFGGKDMVNDPKVKEIINRHKAIWADAFTQFGQDLLKVDKEDTARADRLLAAQKAIEKINAIPDFESVMDPAKKKPTHLKDYSDSLVRVGNFLGSARDAMPEIGRQQLHVLKTMEGHLKKLASGNMAGSSMHYPP